MNAQAYYQIVNNNHFVTIDTYLFAMNSYLRSRYDRLIIDYQSYFDTWFQFYTLACSDGAMMDIMQHMLIYYVDVRLNP